MRVKDEQAAGQVAADAAADQRRVTMLAHLHCNAVCACFGLGSACAAADKQRLLVGDQRLRSCASLASLPERTLVDSRVQRKHPK